MCFVLIQVFFPCFDSRFRQKRKFFLVVLCKRPWGITNESQLPRDLQTQSLQGLLLTEVFFMDFLAAMLGSLPFSSYILLFLPFPGLLLSTSTLGLPEKSFLVFSLGLPEKSFLVFSFNTHNNLFYIQLSAVPIFKNIKLLWFSLKQRAIYLGFLTFDSQRIGGSFDITIFPFI